MKYLFASALVSIICIVFLSTSCTYNISMAHTSGYADDVIDDTASNTPNVSPVINIPLSPATILRNLSDQA